MASTCLGEELVGTPHKVAPRALGRVVKKRRRDRSKIRGRSGVYPFAVYLAPAPCRTDCVYCPTVAGVPKSYIHNSDTDLAGSFGYDPFAQVQHMLGRIDDAGTETPAKLEVIVLGGTFSELDDGYRSAFVENVYSALNGVRVHQEDAAGWQTNADYRCCVLTVETRPDKITQDECRKLLSLGVSKVELGVQALDDTVLSFVGRPYSVEGVREATNLLKDYGFKVGYHIMLNLPFSSAEKDMEMFVDALWGPGFCPDYLKIYPTTLVDGGYCQPKLRLMKRGGAWTPASVPMMVRLVAGIKQCIPRFARLSRVGRQFDGRDSYGAIDMRGAARTFLKAEGAACGCIRCREVGYVDGGFRLSSEDRVDVRRMGYNAGADYFIEALAGDLLLGYCRVRLGDTATIRELRVLGRAAPIGRGGPVQGQRVGLRLLQSAEELVTQRGYKEVLVTAAPGARGYFLPLGYQPHLYQLRKVLSV